MMKITGLSHLFKSENLHNWWLTKYFFAPLYIYIYNYVSYTYYTVYVEECVCFEIFLLTSGVSLFVCGAHAMWFMRTQMCIMKWV